MRSVIVFAVFAVATFAGILAFLALSGWAAESGWFIVLATLAGSVILSLLVHEGGHLLAGLVVGMRPVLLILGPLTMSWRRGQFFPRLSAELMILGGLVVCVPSADRPVRLQIMTMIAMGPLTSLLLALAAAIAAVLTTGDLSYVAAVTGTVSALFFLMTVLPYSVGGQGSDGRLLCVLARDDRNARSLTASLLLLAAAWKGEPLVRWPQQLIDTALRADADSNALPSALHLAYWVALDANDEDRAESLLSELQSLTANSVEWISTPVAFEAAAFYLFVHHEPETARELIDGRKPTSFGDRCLETVIRAGLAIMERERDRAALWVRAARRDLPKALFPPVAALHARWLEQVEAELARSPGPWDAASRVSGEKDEQTSSRRYDPT